MAAIRIIIVFLCFLSGVATKELAAPPAFSNVGGNGYGSGQSCRYEFTVPDKVGMCSSGNAALESKIDNVKADLDRSRLQYVSQNTILQDQMSKMQNSVNGYGSQINDLYNHVRQIQGQMGSQSSSHGPGTNELQKLVQTTKDTFNKAIHDMENKLFNITVGYQKDAIEQSKVNAAMEMQVRLQDQRTEKVEKDIKDLLNLVSNIQSNPGTPSGTSNVNPAALKDVKDSVKHLDQQIQMYDQLQQQQFSALQLKGNELALKLGNHSHQLNDLSVQSQALSFRLTGAQTKADTVSIDMDDFKSTTVPKINKLTRDMEMVKNDTKDLRKTLEDVATKSMNADVHSLMGAADIHNLQLRMNLLTDRIKGVLDQLSTQSSTIKNLSKDLGSLSSTLNPTQLQAMQAAINALKNTGNIGSVSQSQLQQVETEIQHLNDIVAALQKAPPGLVIATTPKPATTKQPFVVPPTTPNMLGVPTTKSPFVAPTTKVPNLGKVTMGFVVPTIPKAPTLQTTPGFAVPQLPHGGNK